MRKIFKSVLAVLVIGAMTAAAVYLHARVRPVPARQAVGRVPTGRCRWWRRRRSSPTCPVWLEGVGSAKARNLVTVRPQVDGKIMSVDFKEGQEVKKGDVLAQIDPVTFKAQLDQAIAKKALDEAQLANAKRDLERYTSLSANVIAAKTVDTQRALVAQLEAQIKSDDAAIENARAILGYASVVAPISGRTGMRMVDVGNLVRASDARHRRHHRGAADLRAVHPAAAGSARHQPRRRQARPQGRGAGDRQQERARYGPA